MLCYTIVVLSPCWGVSSNLTLITLRINVYITISMTFIIYSLMVYVATHCESREKGSNPLNYIMKSWIVINARYNVYLRNFIRSDWSVDVYYTCCVQKCNKGPYRLKHGLRWI